MTNNQLVRRDCIRFNRAAEHFGESSVIGNGRLGAMVFGSVVDERIVLNENSVWSGSVQDADKPNAYQYLSEVRNLLFEGRPAEAQQLFYSNFTCQGEGTNMAQSAEFPYGCYQILGHLSIHNHQLPSQIQNYNRTLDMSKEAISVTFTAGGIRYSREYFCSMKHEAFLMHISADQKGKISFDAMLDRPECFEIVTDQDTLMMYGQLCDGKGGGGVRYACMLRIEVSGGKLSFVNNQAIVENADEATIYITAATNLKGFLGRELDDEQAAVKKDMDSVWGKSFQSLFREHLNVYMLIYNAVSLELPACEQDQLDILSRMKQYIAGKEDIGILALCFNFGRYLLLCSSRKDGIPSNLQGLWAEEIQTPWNGDWHINAQQMIYWPAEICNMGDQHIPYLRLTKKLVKPGSKTAQCYYGCKGWVAHTCTNVWGFTSPGEQAEWGSTVGSSAWLCHHLWEHYLYTMDQKYLEWAYPTIRGCAEFFVDYLVEHPKYGWLVTAPSSSPENQYYDEKGNMCAICAGPTYDEQLIYHLFKICIQASKILETDKSFREILIEKIDRLALTRIGWDGRIMEWLEDYEEVWPYHRHLSHLWAVYPGYEINLDDTPELAEAAYKSVRKRKFTGPGWATAYRACIYARLHKAEEAFAQIKQVTGMCSFPNLMNTAFHGDETIPVPQNPRLDEFPDYKKKPFQMDGNSGATMAIAMLFFDDKIILRDGQEAETVIYLLPALPKEIPNGKISGLVAKGGFIVSIEWKNGRLVKADISGKINRCCTVKYQSIEKQYRIEAGETVTFEMDSVQQISV